MGIERLGIHESVGSTFPPEKLREYLTGRASELTVEIVADEIGRCDGLVTRNYSEQFLDGDLRWLHSIQAGVDRFPFEDLETNGIALTNSSGVHDESVGETVAGYMLQFARLLHRFRWEQRERTWYRSEWDEQYTLGESSLCVVGLGALGTGIAERASALGMSVTGVRRSAESTEHVERVYPAGELRTAIADAEFVALAVPLTEETERLIGGAELDAMRRDAHLINVARGGVVDQDALIAALREGEIAGAALDVFETEPLPAESPLWEMENVIVTPHAAGRTRDYYRRVGEIVDRNIDRISDGDRLVNRVV